MMMVSFLIIYRVTTKILKTKYASRYEQFGRTLLICAVWSITTCGLLGLRFAVDGFMRHSLGDLMQLDTKRIGSWGFLVVWSISITASEYLA